MFVSHEVAELYCIPADELLSSPVHPDAQPTVDWLQYYGTQSGDHGMLLSLDSPELSDAVMQDASQQTSPQFTSAQSQQPMPSASGNLDPQAQGNTSTAPTSTNTGAVAMDGVQATGQLCRDAATVSKLQRANFQSKEAALTWLTGDGYAKARTALLPLGLTDSWEIALLQPHQLTTLPGLVPVLRNKMCLILDKLICDAERVQMVFERHHSWLEEHLGMEVAGSVASTFHRLCETLSCYKAMAVVQC